MIIAVFSVYDNFHCMSTCTMIVQVCDYNNNDFSL